MIIQITDEFFVKEGERWEVRDCQKDILDFLHSRVFDMQSSILHTLSVEYLMDCGNYSHRLTTVTNESDEILAFAFLNAEIFQLPDSIFQWDGLECLNQNSLSMQGTDLRSKLRKKEFVDIEVSHIAAVGASAECTKGLGRRVIKFQDTLALGFGHKSKLIALEAIKPLNSELYPEMGFQNTTSTFYQVDDTSTLVPMFKKINDAKLVSGLENLEKPTAIQSSFRSLNRACPIPREKLQFVWRITEKIILYLWNTKDDVEAKELLRQLTVRAKYKYKQVLKLWSMRRRCLSYNKKPHEKTELVVDDNWFQQKVLIRKTENIQQSMMLSPKLDEHLKKEYEEAVEKYRELGYLDI